MFRRLRNIKRETAGITSRIVKRDFTGDTGIAIKNSLFNLSTNVLAKIGSIVFTVILARMLMPELFGLYSLALSTLIIFSSFSDLGISTAVTKFMAKEVGKKKGDPDKYYIALLKWKLLLVLVICLAVILSAGFLSHSYYNKPIFLALIAGGLYIFSSSLVGFFISVFQVYNDFQKNFIKEIIFQTFRLMLVPLAIILFLSKGTEQVLFAIFLSLSIPYLISLIYLIYTNKKYSSLGKLNSQERKDIFWFVFPLSATALSGMFFGYIDMIMLGRFVESEFIGYYQAAISLISSTGALIGFSGALFPLFSRLRGKRLQVLFRKSVKYTFILSLVGTVGIMFFAGIGITIIYGPSYSPSILLLRVLSLLILIDPLIGVYSGFNISQGKTALVAVLLIISTCINILLNYYFIIYGLTYSHYAAAFGAAIATILAKGVHLGGLIFFKRYANRNYFK